MFEVQIQQARGMIARLEQEAALGWGKAPPSANITREEYNLWIRTTNGLVEEAFGPDSRENKAWEKLKEDQHEVWKKWLEQDPPYTARAHLEPEIHCFLVYIALLEQFDGVLTKKGKMARSSDGPAPAAVSMAAASSTPAGDPEKDDIELPEAPGWVRHLAWLLDWANWRRYWRYIVVAFLLAAAPFILDLFRSHPTGNEARLAVEAWSIQYTHETLDETERTGQYTWRLTYKVRNIGATAALRLRPAQTCVLFSSLDDMTHIPPTRREDFKTELREDLPANSELEVSLKEFRGDGQYNTGHPRPTHIACVLTVDFTDTVGGSHRKQTCWYAWNFPEPGQTHTGHGTFQRCDAGGQFWEPARLEEY